MRLTTNKVIRPDKIRTLKDNDYSLAALLTPGLHIVYKAVDYQE